MLREVNLEMDRIFPMRFRPEYDLRGSYRARGALEAPPQPHFVAAALLAAVDRRARRDFAVRTATVNCVGCRSRTTASFGNSFTTRTASFEFPLGSGYEHMSRAGLWVARALDDAGVFTGVSAAIVDNLQGSSARTRPSSRPRRARFRRAFAHPQRAALVAERDLGPGPDRRVRRHAGQAVGGFQRAAPPDAPADHAACSLGFTLEAADAFVVTSFTIHNDGPCAAGRLVGLYAQLVSGNREAFSRGRPRAAGPGLCRP